MVEIRAQLWTRWDALEPARRYSWLWAEHTRGPNHTKDEIDPDCELCGHFAIELWIIGRDARAAE